MNADGLPKEAFTPWIHDIKQCFNTTVSNAEDSVRVVDTLVDDNNALDSPDTTANSSKQALTDSIASISKNFIITTTDKAPGCYALMCKRWYMRSFQNRPPFLFLTFVSEQNKR